MDKKEKKISLLPHFLIDQIAAGEVIENPACVVKELIENALDAKASAIVVEIEGGGQTLIRVSDNGSGMGKEDALFCFQRHATSKIKEEKDLQTISTLGFRGEALSSIASIAKVELTTCLEGEREGSRVIVSGGQIVETAPCARAQGTTFSITSLFYNVPARKKFQKSIATSRQQIIKTIEKIALAHPDKAFILQAEGKTIFSLQKPLQKEVEKKEKIRIQELLGREIVEKMLFIRREKSPYHIHGWIGKPAAARLSRASQYLFVNERAIVSPFLTQTIRRGYGTRLGEKEHPIFLLFFQIDPKLVDVNVHPQKKEVRFQEEKALEEILLEMITSSLEGVYSPFSSRAPIAFPSFSPKFKAPSLEEKSFSLQESLSLEVGEEIEVKQEQLSIDFGKQEPSLDKGKNFQEIAVLGKYFLIKGEIEIRDLSDKNFSDERFREKSQLIVVDLQRAYSRSLFETVFSPQEKKESQSFLFPLTWEVSSSVMEKAPLVMEGLKQRGIEVRVIGEKTLALDALPPYLDKEEFPELFSTLIENGCFSHFSKEEEKKLSRIASRMAKRKKSFSSLEARGVVERLFTCQTPYICPLGSPTMICWTEEECSKLFEGKSF